MHATLRRDLLLQEPQHIPAAEYRDPMMHQPGHKAAKAAAERNTTSVAHSLCSTDQ